MTADELDRLWAIRETVRPEEFLGSWKPSARPVGRDWCDDSAVRAALYQV
ncbi:hypothetical protein [Streptomyces sp. NRRL S-337]|nr:hypothetical protein [Streptomyces sp. NRRL S-337]